MAQYELKVGQGAPIKTNIFTSNHHIIYGGMISDDRFSLVITYSSGYHCMGYNLYCSTRQREVYHRKGMIRILRVSSDSISIEIH